MSAVLMHIFSHEFRTPFAVIQSSAELLQMSVLNQSSEDNQFLYGLTQNILREIAHVTNILNKVVMLNRMESQTALQKSDPLDVVPLVERVLHATFEPWTDGRRVSLSVEGQPRLVRADPVMFDIVCRNLVENACKYSPGAPPPFVSLFFRPSGWGLSVKDFGIGIPPADLGRIGTPFFRASNAENAAQGTGLGMSIVRYIVERFEGQLLIDSVEGKGTMISLAFYEPVPAEKVRVRPVKTHSGLPASY